MRRIDWPLVVLVLYLVGSLCFVIGAAVSLLTYRRARMGQSEHGAALHPAEAAARDYRAASATEVERLRAEAALAGPVLAAAGRYLGALDDLLAAPAIYAGAMARQRDVALRVLRRSVAAWREAGGGP